MAELRRAHPGLLFWFPASGRRGVISTASLRGTRRRRRRNVHQFSRGIIFAGGGHARCHPGAAQELQRESIQDGALRAR